MPTAKSYAGRILSVDLGTGAVRRMDTRQYAERFLGGRGLATAIYWSEVRPEIDAFDERNRMILAVGPLAGVPALGGSRWGVYAKAARPQGHRFCYGNLGGGFGAELKFAGYDALIIRGKADRPVLLSIHGGDIRLSSAEDLWGKSTTETIERLKRRQGGGARVLTIGPAGERLVPYATLFADGDASCSGGMGAVMGSKMLKAVVVRGENRAVDTARPAELREMARELRGNGRGNVKVWGIDFMAHGPKTRKLPCYGCPANCLRVKYTAEDGSSGKFMCQSRFFYMPHAWGYYGQENDVPFHANRLCDELGIDTWEVQTVIEWLLRCHAEGVITEAESGLPLDKVGSLEFIERLLGEIVAGEDFGALLAGGAYSAARKRGPEALALFRHNDPYDPRYCTVNTLLYPFEPREPIQQLHEAGLVLAQWSSWAKGVAGAHISTAVVRGIARRFWGSESAGDFTTLAGKALAARRIQDRQYAKESLVTCDWMFPVIDLPDSEDHVGDPGIESRILSAATGIEHSEEDLNRIGARIFNLQRAIALREGHRAGEDDVLPREFHHQPLEGHVADPECLVPGGDGRIVSRIGERVDMKQYLRLREEYYQLRGWDVNTGMQTREGLAQLELAEAAEDLDSRGLLARRARRVPPLLRLARQLRLQAGAQVRLWRGARGEGSPAAGPSGHGCTGPGMSREELLRLLEEQCSKYAHPRVARNFRGWNKDMQYHISDFDEYFLIRMIDGVAQAPEALPEPLPGPEISYQMDSETLRAMTRGELSGQQAFRRRRLKLKASFQDMMKLQSLDRL
ncbi:MAG: SCP2 sterol-binding domain-containing protein [Spirochaetales bacterium]|nr:SCP2 sterol-binding domain-containing protein [Spirochaetales bacterium]